jgi:hypothetical protein
MEIVDGPDIEILCTIQKIGNIEQTLRRHISAKSEDLILKQYQTLKADLCKQLACLVSEAIGARVEIAV